MMKNRLALFAVFLPILCFAQTDIYLSDPIPITADNASGYRLPHIGLLDDGRQVVQWTNNNKIYLATRENGVFGLPMEVDLAGQSLDIFGGELGPSMAAKGQSVFIVFEKYGQGIYCVRSTDGGATFDVPVTIFQAQNGRIGTLPAISISADGNPVVSYVNTNNNEQDARYEVAVSTDGGATFQAPVIASAAADGEEVCECCPGSMIAAEDGSITLAFRNNDNNERDIWLTRSTDGGATFPLASDVDETDWEAFICPTSGANIYATESQLITAFYSGASDWENGIYVSIANADDLNFISMEKMPDFDGEMNNQASSDINGVADTVGLVWMENIEIGNDIRLAYSTDGGGNLASQIVNLTEDSEQQRHPEIAYKNGIFHIVYENSSQGIPFYQQASFSPLSNVQQQSSLDIEVIMQPNPLRVGDALNIEVNTATNLTVNILNLNGILIKTATINTQRTIELKDLQAGIYLIQLTDGKGIVTKKITIIN